MARYVCLFVFITVFPFREVENGKRKNIYAPRNRNFFFSFRDPAQFVIMDLLVYWFNGCPIQIINCKRIGNTSILFIAVSLLFWTLEMFNKYLLNK